MKKKQKRLWILGCGCACLAGLILLLAVGAFFALRPYVVCISGADASITARGPMAYVFHREWLKREDTVDCGHSEPDEPIVCRYNFNFTSVTVRDRGTLGITLYGTHLCQELKAQKEREARK